MTRAQIYLLFVANLALMVAVFALLSLTPPDVWYGVPLALLLGVFTSLSIARLVGWIP